MTNTNAAKAYDNDKFFETLNRVTDIPNRHSKYHPLDEEQRRSLKRQRKLEKRARKQESQRHSDKFQVNSIEPITEKQGVMFDSFRAGKHILAHGYAGTGKTYVAMYLALENIFATAGSGFKKIITIRSVVPSRDMGYLPGSVQEKIKAYEEPYVEICDALFGQGNGYNILRERGLFEFTTTSYLRGVTFNDAIVIVDEIQNMTFQELDTVITRIGENCRIIFCGDFRQTDLDKDTDKAGLAKFMSIIHKLPGFEYIEFGRDDIVRSDLVKEYIIARTEEEEKPKPIFISRMFDPLTAHWFDPVREKMQDEYNKVNHMPYGYQPVTRYPLATSGGTLGTAGGDGVKPIKHFDDANVERPVTK